MLSKSKMKVAILDLGTNTCNLLIAEYSATAYNIIQQSKQLVRLGDFKIKDNLVSNKGIERVLKVLGDQLKIIAGEGIESIRIIATSAIRDAKNKTELLNAISDKTGYPLEVVSGEKEAELIFKGVLLAMESFKKKSLILDIGGGSNELIIAHKRKILWKESQPTGMARITNQFVLSDPLKPKEIQILQNFYAARHLAALQQCKKRAVNTLIGCSGSFDTIADIIDQVNAGEKQRKLQEIGLAEFYSVHNLLVSSTRKQRMGMKGMDSVRVDLIVPAIVFIEQIIKQAGINKIIQTGYALREGVLFELMQWATDN
jgi:exopolyphosphatase / guanosine-5'-triphosphate,3'-diphosphate pyrophosphatase